MVQEIMDLGLVRVDSYGSCLRNQNITGRLDSKHDTFRKYKFCIAMENSIEGDEPGTLIIPCAHREEFAHGVALVCMRDELPVSRCNCKHH